MCQQNKQIQKPDKKCQCVHKIQKPENKIVKVSTKYKNPTKNCKCVNKIHIQICSQLYYENVSTKTIGGRYKKPNFVNVKRHQP